MTVEGFAGTTTAYGRSVGYVVSVKGRGHTRNALLTAQKAVHLGLESTTAGDG